MKGCFAISKRQFWNYKAAGLGLSCIIVVVTTYPFRICNRLSALASAADYEISKSILEDIPQLNQLPQSAEDINEIRLMEEAISELDISLDTLDGLISRDKSSPQYEVFCRALASIRNAHLDLKFDKALDVLYSGDFNKYFNLTEIEANYASYAAKTSRDVSRRMQVL